MKIPVINLFLHRRRRPAQTIQEARDLLKRFQENRPSYDFEWDDFISWKNENPTIEKIRLQLEEIEPLLVTGSENDRSKIHYMLENAINYLNSYMREVGDD